MMFTLTLCSVIEPAAMTAACLSQGHSSSFRVRVHIVKASSHSLCLQSHTPSSSFHSYLFTSYSPSLSLISPPSSTFHLSSHRSPLPYPLLSLHIKPPLLSFSTAASSVLSTLHLSHQLSQLFFLALASPCFSCTASRLLCLPFSSFVALFPFPLLPPAPSFFPVSTFFSFPASLPSPRLLHHLLRPAPSGGSLSSFHFLAFFWFHHTPFLLHSSAKNRMSCTPPAAMIDLGLFFGESNGQGGDPCTARRRNRPP